MFVMQLSPDQSPQQQPTQQSTTQAQPQAAAPKPKKAAGPLLVKTMTIAIFVIIIAIVAAVIFVYPMLGKQSQASTTTSIGSVTTKSTTSISQEVYGLTGCSNITSSGTYSISSRVKTYIPRGACINIMASDVELSCNGNRIQGSGPFDALPPFTEGINIEGASNVTISNCAISNFSYGIEAFDSSGVSVMNNNISSNYMSNIYFNSTTKSRIENNFLARALSWQGSLFLSNASITNLVLNNTISYNQVYGVNVSSSGENFSRNTVNISSQFGFYCSPSVSYPTSSSASGNICYDNYGCAFLKCNGQNLPANISKIILTTGIYGCGEIDHPGSYAIEQNIDMGDYLNVSNPSSSNEELPCIAVRASDVKLNCAGHYIYNSTYSIGAYGSEAVDIVNCNIRNASGYGVVLEASPNSTVSNTTTLGAKGGVLIANSNSDNVTNSSFSKGKYGITVNDSQSDNFLGVNASKNLIYGFNLVGASIGNNFYASRAFNNSQIDVFAANNITGAQTNFVSSMACYSTNTHWAPCKIIVVPNLGYTPVNGCISISSPGTYVLQSGLLDAQNNCIAITASNVVFDCANNYISTTRLTSVGYGVTVNDADNVEIENCTLQGFQGGVSAHDTKNLTVSNVRISYSAIGISLNISKGSMLQNDTINGSTSYGIQLIGVNSSTVGHDNILYGSGTAIGLALNDSRLNSIFNNSVSQYRFGFAFSGTSNNNTVSNNTATLSTGADFVCNGNVNSELASEFGGINFGTVKDGCKWLALIQSLTPNPPCISTTNADTYSLNSDYVYPYGSVCFDVNNNGTTINCNGHTITATNGGVFTVFAKGTTGSIVENCYLKGFTTAIEALNGSANIYNNTIQQTNPQSTAIMVDGFIYGSIDHNNVTGGLISVAAYNTINSNLEDNYARLSHIAYYIYNASGIQIIGDYAASSTTYGLVLNDTILGSVKQLTLNSNAIGLSCQGSSQKTTLISDNGGLSCRYEGNCAWVHSSSGTC